MNKNYFFSIIFLFFSWSAFGQLTGMNPASASHAQILTTAITGNGIFMQSSSPAGNIFSIKLTRGLDVIEAFQYIPMFFGNGSVNVVDANTANLDLEVPITVMGGVYDLEVVTGDTMFPNLNQNTYSLPGAFTILPPDGYITGTAYDDLNRNGIKDVGEPGVAGRTINLQPNDVDCITNINGDFLFAVDNGSYSVSISNTFFDFRFLTSADDTLNVVINNNNSSANDFGLRAALVSVTPNVAYPGITTTHTLVADTPIFIPGGGASGNIYSIQILTSPYVIYTGGIILIDSVTAQFTVTIHPSTVPVNNLDIRVYLTSGIVGNHILNHQFDITPAPSLITGTVYDDLNKDGVKDAGEPGIQGRQVYKISGGAYAAVTDTNGNYSLPTLNGNFDIKVADLPADHMLVTSEDTISVTINNNNSNGNDFGLKRTLVSITPNTAYLGMTTTHQIVADEPIFSGATISAFYVQSSPYSLYIPGNNVVIIDSVTVQVNLTVPLSIDAGNNLDIFVRVGPGTLKHHFLKQQFNILTPPNAVTGTLFLDQNQNKLKDTGEPGIKGGKVILTPDNSFGFSDNAGDFFVGSFGGIQTLTYANNVSSIQLYTDSTSYTFNATGVVTGKDFGFISSNPDYTLDMFSTYMLRRCNSYQNATLQFYNVGTINTDVVAWIKYDPLMTYITAPIPPTAITGDTIFWNIPNVVPFTNTYVKALFSLPNAGDTVEVTYGVNALDGTGTIQYTESSTVVYPISCSFDPNDKQVTPPGVLAQNYTLMSDSLEYLIRFQNTGNDTAYQVVVLDTLDNNLDLNTFEILGSSHSMQTEVESSGATRFSFNNIMLPDSNANEPESHGFIQYRIQAKTGLSDNTPVNNTAHIFFDLNPDVVTNTTLNTLVYILPTGIHETANGSNGVSIYPNPFTNSTTVYFENTAAEKFEFYISSLTGKQIAPVQITSGDTFTIQRNTLSNGIYFYELKNALTGISRYGKFVIE